MGPHPAQTGLQSLPAGLACSGTRLAPRRAACWLSPSRSKRSLPRPKQLALGCILLAGCRCAGKEDVITIKAEDGGDTVTFLFETPSEWSAQWAQRACGCGMRQLGMHSVVPDVLLSVGS